MPSLSVLMSRPDEERYAHHSRIPLVLVKPHHLQEPWAALIDTGAVTSIAASFAPHVHLSEHSGQLVNVNGGDIKILDQKKVTYVAHKVVMNITFITVEDVMRPNHWSGCPASKWGSTSSVSEWERISSAA